MLPLHGREVLLQALIKDLASLPERLHNASQIDRVPQYDGCHYQAKYQAER